MAGTTFVVVEDVVTRIVAMHAQVLVADDAEAPGLRVVAAGCPAREIQQLEQGLTVHGGGRSVVFWPFR